MESITNVKFEDEEKFAVEFEVVPINEVERKRKQIEENIASLDTKLEEIQKKLDASNEEIERLTSYADGLDYMVAVASGVIAGAIDVLFVEEFSLEKANTLGNEKVNDFVLKKAKEQGYKGNDLSEAVKYMEKKFPIVADKATNAFGGGYQHHLRDFSHHPTLIGLGFSFLTQFTYNVYGTDTAGCFKVYPLKEKDYVLIGKNLPEKITFGVINWFFHMVSDMAGSSGSVEKGSLGTGLPGPIVSLLKEVSVLPIFKNTNKSGYKEFSVWISKLFNGTLLGERDADGKLVPLKFDMRTEIGIGEQLKQQAIPVIVNECIVRGFYFIRHLIEELKLSQIDSFESLKNLNWKKTLPFKNRTISRMLTISLGTMTAIDVADAAIRSAIKSGGVANPAFFTNAILRVNFVGIGRFAIAIGTDVGMEIERNKTIKQRSQMLSDIICVSNIKLYYKNADLMCSYAELYEKESNMYAEQSEMWMEVRKTHSAIEQLYCQMEKVGEFYSIKILEMDDSFDEIKNVLPKVEKMNPGLLDEIRRRLV